MKTKIIILITFVVFYFTSKSQTYKPFPSDSAIWGLHMTALNGHGYGKEIIKGDTLLGGQNYNKVYSSPGNVLQGFYREVGKKIYSKIIGYVDTSEFLIYDFNLNVGDTFYDKRTSPTPASTFYYKYVVNTISTTTLTTDVRKQYNFDFAGYQGSAGTYSNLGNSCNFFWIEGIGSLKGVFNNRASTEGTECHFAALISNAVFANLECFEHKAIQYMSKSCVTLNQKELSNISIIKIYPNPANELLTLQFDVESNYKKVLIYNSIGQLIREEEISGQEKIIDTEELPNGVYLLKLFDSTSTSSAQAAQSDRIHSASKRFIIAR